MRTLLGVPVTHYDQDIGFGSLVNYGLMTSVEFIFHAIAGLKDWDVVCNCGRVGRLTLRCATAILSTVALESIAEMVR